MLLTVAILMMLANNTRYDYDLIRSVRYILSVLFAVPLKLFILIQNNLIANNYNNMTSHALIYANII